MRIQSGATDRYIYFVAVDATDLKTRETGLSSFTVYRSRNGAAAAAMSGPTVNETDASNMPGVYELLLDEDTTIAAANDAEEMVLHVTKTGMAPVTRVVELYRPETTAGRTLSLESDGVGHADVKEVLGDATSATDLKDFADAGYDPGTNKVQGVVLVDTTSTNSDMRGTNSAALASNVPDSLSHANLKIQIITDYHLDHLLAADYNPASKPGTGTALLNELVENNSGVSRFTSASLDQAWSVTARILTAATNITSDASAITMSSSGVVGAVNLANTITTYSGNTLQTGDAYARLGAPAGASVSADVATRSSHTAANVWTSATRTLTDGAEIKKNAAFSNFEVLMVDSGDHVTPKTGLTVTGQKSIDGGSFSAVAGAIAEVSNGIYQFDALAADTNGDVITWKFAASGADSAYFTFKTRPS